MNNADDNKEFILSNSLLAHQRLFSEPNIHYLTIQSGSEIVGFIILVVEAELKSVNFAVLWLLKRIGNKTSSDKTDGKIRVREVAYNAHLARCICS
ncbi:hypothetical protein [Pseudoalteromonas sp. HM-SA03]|uniref:hypothetical protein n=1 Tax=Pseudoalteromonas sp. HM-SA03 TaxID=2029678 RepID=UPI0020D19AFF|nr:hypothetical protein [Pseudoalteromonas sp. HM-SA03]